MAFALTTAGRSALQGGAPLDENFAASVQFGSSQAAATIANGIVTAPTAIRTPIVGAVPYPRVAVLGLAGVDGLPIAFQSPPTHDAAAYTAYEIGMFNSGGVMVAYEAGETTALLTKDAGTAGTLTTALVLTGVTNPTIQFASTTIQAASETLAGLVELANQAEADAGTDALKAMTPALVARRIDAGAAVNFQRFTASGTWTKPANSRLVIVEAIGAGANGEGSTGLGTYAGGGLSGDLVLRVFRASDLPATVAVRVGTGNTTFTGFIFARAARGVWHDNPSRTDAVLAERIGQITSLNERGSSALSRGGQITGTTNASSAGHSGDSEVAGGTAGTAGSINGGNGADSLTGIGGGGGAGYGANLASVGGNGGAPGGGGGAGRATGGRGARGEVRVWAF